MTDTIMQTNKKRVAVLFGGFSPEHEISLKSAYAIIKNMNRQKYEIIAVGITRNGGWFRYTGDIEKIWQDTWDQNEQECFPVYILPDRNERKLIELKNGMTSEIPIDIAFPVLHGKNGEDGTLQGLFELIGVPIVGCDTLSSALCMDKFRAHKLAETAGIKAPAAVSFFADTPIEQIRELTKHLRYPLFLKPIAAGSSLGITRMSSADELEAAVSEASVYDNNIIVEEGIEGFEVGCAVLGNDKLITGEVDEIELEGDWFDFKEKYTQKHSMIHMPARLDEATRQRIKEAAVIIYRALGCCGFARVDMFYSKGGEIYFNEINTIPGLTELSRFPKMMRGAGFTFPDLVDKVIELGFDR